MTAAAASLARWLISLHLFKLLRSTHQQARRSINQLPINQRHSSHRWWWHDAGMPCLVLKHVYNIVRNQNSMLTTQSTRIPCFTPGWLICVFLLIDLPLLCWPMRASIKTTTHSSQSSNYNTNTYMEVFTFALSRSSYIHVCYSKTMFGCLIKGEGISCPACVWISSLHSPALMASMTLSTRNKCPDGSWRCQPWWSGNRTVSSPGPFRDSPVLTALTQAVVTAQSQWTVREERRAQLHR